VAQRIEVQISGRVQGVAFRWYTREQAQQLGVVGTVRNSPDGSVQVVAEGPRETLERFLRWLAQGPERALVTQCDCHWTAARAEYDEFLITG